MDVNQYLEIFIEESLEHLQELNQNLLSLETNPGDMKTLNEIFRVAHTLKGMAGTMGFTGISNLTHQMENVLDAIRTGNVEVNSSMIDILFECLDYLSNSINTISATGKESSSNVNSIIAGLNGMLAKKPEAEASDTADKKEPEESKMKFNQYDDNIIKKAAQQNLGVFKITVVLSKDCMLKSARAFLVFQTVERYA